MSLALGSGMGFRRRSTVAETGDPEGVLAMLPFVSQTSVGAGRDVHSRGRNAAIFLTCRR